MELTYKILKLAYFFTTGLFMGASFGLLLSGNWRSSFLLCLSSLVVYFIGWFLIPEM